MANNPVEQVYWRDASRPVKFFMWDAESSYPLVVWMLFPHTWLLIVVFIAMVFFTLLSRYGISLVVFLRIFRSFLAGPRKFVRPWWTV